MISKVEAGQLNVETEVGALAGHIEFVYLRNLTRGTRYREEDLPRTFPCGDRVSATCEFFNDDSAKHSLLATIKLLDPDGGKHCHTSYRHTFDPGESVELTSEPVFTLNKVGTWKIYAVLTD